MYRLAFFCCLSLLVMSLAFAFLYRFYEHFSDPCDVMICNYYAKCAASEDGTASCQCNRACPMIYKPVCGSDGKEYANKCVMEFESCTSKKMIYIVKRGKCNDKSKAFCFYNYTNHHYLYYNQCYHHYDYHREFHLYDNGLC